MKHATAREMEELDRRARDEFGIPLILLMENAGRSVCEEALDMMGKEMGKVTIVCGKGNNGGDGFTAARHLMNNGVDIEIFLIGEPEKLKGDALTNYEIITKMGALVRELSFESMEFFRQELARASLIIDCIFGTGLSREVKEPYKTVINLINNSGKPVLSVDVPSGLDATTGEIYGVCVKATRTAALSLPKKGFVEGDGPEVTGEVVVKDISIPKQILD